MLRKMPQTACAMLLLAACQQATSPQDDPAASTPTETALPSTVAALPAETEDGGSALATFLTSIYGSGAGLDREWNGVPSDPVYRAQEGETTDGTVTRRVCEHETTEYNGKPAVMLAVCGIPKDFGHPTPGITDFFLLQGQPLAAVASARLQQFGSMGSAGEIDAERFGANLPGFIVESGFTGQGHTTVNRTVLVPKDDGFHEAGSFLASMDDNLLRKGCTDGPTCQPGKDYEIEFELDIDDFNRTAKTYPLVVHEQGKACGAELDKRYTLTLDPATLTYDIPAALRRELACEVPAG